MKGEENKNENSQTPDYVKKFLEKQVISNTKILCVGKKEDALELVEALKKDKPDLISVTVRIDIHYLKKAIKILESIEKDFRDDECDEWPGFADITVTKNRPLILSGNEISISISPRIILDEETAEVLKLEAETRDSESYSHTRGLEGELLKSNNIGGNFPLPYPGEAVSIEFAEDPKSTSEGIYAEVYLFGRYELKYDLIIVDNLREQLIKQGYDDLKGLKGKVFVLRGKEDLDAPAEEWSIQKEIFAPETLVIKHREDLEKLRDENMSKLVNRRKYNMWDRRF